MMADVVAQMGPAFLGSRLKRLGERMQASAALVTSSAGLALQPGHMAVLAALRNASMSVGQLAEACGTSQPGVTRTLGQLRDLGMIDEAQAPDQRSRVVALSTKGREAVAVLTREVWPRVGMAAEQILAQVDGDFLAALAVVERALSEASISERGLRVSPGPLRLREYDDALAHHFHDINAEWIEGMFRLEPTDREVLENGWDAISIGERLSAFKEWKSKAAQKTVSNQRRLEAAVTPRTTARSAPVMTDDDAFLQGFNSARGK